MSAFKIKAVGGGDAADAGEFRRAFPIFWGPGEHRELRALPSGRGREVSADDPDGALAAFLDLSDETVYFSVNPIKPGSPRASKATVVDRRWIYVDVDPIRPEGVSATDEEKGGAARVASLVCNHLADLGWPSPIIVDSGNGWHLYSRVDLPNDALSQQIVRGVFAALARLFDDGKAAVDVKVHDAPRIAKMPGTLARKGPDTADRPHRYCRLAHIPASIEVVPIGLLRALSGIDGQPTPAQPVTPQAPASPFAAKAQDGPGVEAYARRALEAELGRLAMTGHQRNNALYESALKLAGLVAAGALDEREVRQALERVAAQVGLGTDGDPKEVQRAIDNAFAVGLQTPRDLSGVGVAGKQQQAQPQAKAPIPPDELIVWASSIQPKSVTWLWPGRIPSGKMTTFAGQGGLGKTFVLCDIAARVSRGSEWPFGQGLCADMGKVLFISGEDDEDDTLVPRLIECGADLGQIAFLSAKAQGDFTLAALEILTGAMGRMKDVRFVAIDPPTSYLGGVDDHKNAELRGLLTPLKNWAAEHKVALVFNNHVNKATGPNIDAASRVMGSVAWVNAVRAAHMFAKDPDDPDRVLFVPLKINVGKKHPGLAYRIVPTIGDLARVEWIEEVHQSADDALSKQTRKPGGKDAAETLIEMFNRQREWPGDDFWKELKHWGVSNHAFKQVRDALVIPRPRRAVMPNGDPVYTWWVPPDWPHLARVCGGAPN